MPQATSNPSAAPGWRDELWPLALVLALSALFFFSFFNRFAGLRSGDGEFSGGIAFLQGHLPYRDTYTAGPPLNQLKSALLLWLFGKTLFVSRFCAVLERFLLAAILFAWLRRNFSRIAAAAATLVTIIISAGDRTDPLASYNHDAILFAMLCGLAASFALSSTRSRNLLLFAAASGLGAGLSSLAKQTIGLGTTVAVLVIATAAFLSLHDLRRSALWIAAYLAGFTAPVLALGLVLRHLGVLHAALNMLFVAGPAAKAGHPLDFLTRELSVARSYSLFILLALILLAASSTAIRRSFASAEITHPAHPHLWLRFGLIGLLSIGLPIAIACTPLGAINNVSEAAVYYAFIGLSIAGVALIVAALRGRGDTARYWQLALVAAVGWSVAFTLSLSWPAFQAMALPGLGLLLAAAIDGTHTRHRALYFVLALLVFLQVREKLNLPFSFDYQYEPPIRLATAASTLPALRGMRLPPTVVHLLDETTLTMDTQSTPSDTVFTYPEMSLFYALSNRTFPTRTGSHNIDVVNDTFARQEAQRLLDAPPRVLLYARPSLAQLQNDEIIWRHGHPSGQRALVAALDCLAARYTLTGTFQVTPADNTIRLYVRPRTDSGPIPCTLPTPVL